jgi:sugar phosphate isomerase/epimerase/FMN phosphatase YigB (HAD superfamily)
MIKNLIFDFGQVMVSFKRKYMVEQFVTDPEDSALLQEVVFDRLYWDRLDAGSIEDEEVLRLVCERIPERLHKSARDIYYNWIYNIPEIEGMSDLILEIKRRFGVKVYLLSNISKYFAAHADEIKCLTVFDGYVLSSTCGFIKPNRDIYEHICTKFSLIPEECIFIDDRADNIEGAENFGINGYIFDGDVLRLKKHLINLLTDNKGEKKMKRSDMKIGSSSCFTGALTEELLTPLAKAGLDYLEYTGNYVFYMRTTKFPENAEKILETVRKSGLEPWSFHLPFSRKLDISNPDKELRAVTIVTNRTLIEAAARAGAKVIVLHPSSEPIADEDRPERLRLSREAIIELAEVAKENGVRLAVENLPRTCLTRTSDEMIALVKDTGAGVIFDTNHNLIEDNCEYIKNVANAGLELLSVHISDYYRDENGVLDERHTLPGTGINKWNDIVDTLVACGYEGPLMYEVPAKAKNRAEGDPITPEELTQNMRDLRDGKIC